MAKVFVMDHPLVQHKITMLRDKNTSTKDFRELAEEISLLMAYEVTRDLPLEETEVETPICKTRAKTVSGRSLGIVPILRAGLGMVNGMLSLVPNAKVGHIGLYRDPKTLKPVEYYCKMPDIEGRDFIIVDPMLATGGSASAAITLLKQRGIKNIKFICLVAAPEGVQCLNREHPDVKIYAAALDDRLNENCYILPGLGDAGDRIFGTK